jgi:Bacterial RNA polymerase, alpha chain C terminal domain
MLTCDWCGGEVRTDGALNAVELMIGPLGTARVGTRIGLHYHRDPAGTDTCFAKATRALLDAAVDSTAEEDEETPVVDAAELERIPVLDGPADGFHVLRGMVREQDTCAAARTPLDFNRSETYWILRREGILTFEDLAELTEEELLNVHRIGPKCAAEIKRAMAEHGFLLRGEED